ncbi:MAG: hypothetical protein A2V88_16040 [Elusimicrobia bacterium RBG_16_66_12]|nr:MAG: hypothetical protein A2V88_16040 [Elusimicrobia bacterium RBG_16_66_12]
MRPPILAVLFTFIAAAPARSMQNNVGTAAAEFLRLGAGARSLGMGEAYSAVAEGPDAAYWNPAGLARMSRPEAIYARSELPAGLHHDHLAVGVPCGFLSGTVAVAVTRLSQEDLALVDASNQQLGSFAPHSEVYALAYGRRFSDSDADSMDPRRDYFRRANIPHVERPYVDEREPWTGEVAAGLSLKMISENLGTRSASTFAVDGGGLFRPEDLHELILAGAFRHVGGKIKLISESNPLPGELAASVAYDARVDGLRLLPAFEAVAPYAGNPYGKVGIEAERAVGAGFSAAARFGFSSRAVPDLGVLAGLTAGVGLRAASFGFDAAFQPMSLLGESFRLGVGWRF